MRKAMTCLSTPPFKKSSRFLEPVVNLTRDFLLSRIWSAVQNSLISAPESMRSFLAFNTASDIVSVSAATAPPSYPVAPRFELLLQQQAKKASTVPDIETEIECPRCYDMMVLSSDFDKLLYFCEGCNLSL
jgi:hypothetical protein